MNIVPPEIMADLIDAFEEYMRALEFNRDANCAAKHTNTLHVHISGMKERNLPMWLVNNLASKYVQTSEDAYRIQCEYVFSWMQANFTGIMGVDKC